MGNFWKKSDLTRDEVLQNIKQINQITKTLPFNKKLKVYLVFELDDKSSSRRKSRKIINVYVSDYDNKENTFLKRKKPLIITINNFYKYFNMLMNSRSIFVESQLNESFQNIKLNTTLGENDSSLCPICTENKVDISLPCSHFFCNGCIKTWLVKSESCPLCRFKLKVDKKGASGVAGAQSWDIIDKVDEEEIKKENFESLQLMTKTLFFKNSKK